MTRNIRTRLQNRQHVKTKQKAMRSPMNSVSTGARPVEKGRPGAEQKIDEHFATDRHRGGTYLHVCFYSS